MINILIFILSIFLFNSCINSSSSHLAAFDSPRAALTTLQVTLDTDNNPGGIGEVGDLRYALNSMNQDLNTVPDDYAITFAFPMTIQLNGALPIVNNSSNPVNITIGNSGSTPTVTIDGNSGAYGGFFIANGSVTIQNINFQNMTAKGGDGGDGISGGGGGMGAGGAIYVPEVFLNGSSPSVTLMNVSINSCSAVGGNGGSYFSVGTPTGNEGAGGGGGLSGNGGSIVTTGTTGGGGGGGFGGNGGNVTLANGGGAGGGGIGSRATLGMLTNLGDGGSDQDPGLNGNGYGLSITAGSGGDGNSGGTNAGGGGGGGASGGGGGSGGSDGLQPQGGTPPDVSAPSGGYGGDGGGGGGGAVVIFGVGNGIDATPGRGGYGGGGGGAAGTGALDTDYTVRGGMGGIGGGGGGGGVNTTGMTPADGGDSSGGGGGAGGGSSQGVNAPGGSDTGHLGGGSGGFGSDTIGAGLGGGGGGGGSGLGGAIFVDSNLNFTIQALSGIPTNFNTSNNTTQAGIHGIGGAGGSDGQDGTAMGNSIFLRSGSSLTLMAQDTNDLLTLGDQVAFADDTDFGVGGTSVFIKGNGTVIYNGTTGYQGNVKIDNANFKVNGQITSAPVSVCRNSSFSAQRGTLSGSGILSGDVFANSGTISPDTGGTLTLGSLVLNSAGIGSLGSLVHIDIDSSGTSLVAVNGTATLAGILEIEVDSDATPGTYTVLTSSAITGTFDSVTFTGVTPTYSISYQPTHVDFILTSMPSPPAPPPDATDLTISIQDHSDPVDINSQISFQVTITNPTDENIEGLSALLALSDNLRFISSEISGLDGENCEGTQSVSCSLGSILANNSVTLIVNVRATAVGALSLGLTVSTEGSTSSTYTSTGTVINNNRTASGGSSCSLNRNAISSNNDSLFFLFLFIFIVLLSFEAGKTKLQ